MIHIDERCEEYGIPIPETFGYPADCRGPEAVEALSEKGYRFARRGIGPEFPFHPEGGRGRLTIRMSITRWSFRQQVSPVPNWGFEDLVWAVEQAKDGKIAILTFHGVPAG